MEDYSLKLDQLSEKSAQKNRGSAAHYIVANVALRDDLLSILSVRFDSLMNDITSVKQELSSCKEELKASAVRENKLLERISALEKNEPGTVNTNSSNKDDFYVVGSSLFQVISDIDLANFKVKCIRGGQIADVKEDIESLSYMRTIYICNSHDVGDFETNSN